MVRFRAQVVLRLNRMELRRIGIASPLSAPLPKADLNMRCGFFASLTNLALLLEHNRLMGTESDFRLTSGMYGKGPPGSDWLADYFDRRSWSDAPDGVRPVIRNIDALRLRELYEDHLEIDSVAELFGTHLCPNHAVLDRVDSFAVEVGRPLSETLGIHFRGTDKVAFESTYTPYSTVLEQTRKSLEFGDYGAVVIASDEPQCIEYIIDGLRDVPVHVLPNSAANSNGRPAHFTAGVDRYVLGLEAMQASLVLAGTGILIRTSSYLSAWSKVFRTDLRTITINKTHRDRSFPERQVVAAENDLGPDCLPQ